MKREILHIARVMMAVLMVLSGWGCAGDDATAEAVGGEPGEPLSFDVAEVVEAKTRSGSAGSIDYSVLSKSTYGFGVVAGAPLDWENQQVTYDESTGTSAPGSAFFYPSKWHYTGDVKYWVKDINGAAVDFYAYAPYVASPAAGTGITAINGTDVSYTINTDITQGVDLLWGVNGSTGFPWKGTTYASTGGPVLFTFRHALAAIGFRAQVMINQTNDTEDFEDVSSIGGVLWTGGENSGNYKVTIKKIELSGDFHSNGTLSLDNGTKNEANWTSKEPEPAKSQTLTVQNSQIKASMKHPNDNAKTTEGSGDSEAKTIMSDTDITGVTQDAQQSVVVSDANDKEQCFFVIPRDGGNYTLKLHWCVSAKLPNEDTYIAEDHVNTINISSLDLKAGTKYLLTFVIGLKLIGLTVEATDWVTDKVDADIIIEHGTSASESLAR